MVAILRQPSSSIVSSRTAKSTFQKLTRRTNETLHLFIEMTSINDVENKFCPYGYSESNVSKTWSDAYYESYQKLAEGSVK